MPHPEERLRFFTFVRAFSGIDYDGDELVVSLRCEDPGEIQEALRRGVGDFACGRFDAGVLTIRFAGGDGDPDLVGQSDYEHARRVEQVLGPYQHQILIPNPDGYYWTQVWAWKGQRFSQSPEPPPASAPVEESLDRVPSELWKSLVQAHLDNTATPMGWLGSELRRLQSRVRGGRALVIEEERPVTLRTMEDFSQWVASRFPLMKEEFPNRAPEALVTDGGAE